MGIFLKTATGASPLRAHATDSAWLKTADGAIPLWRAIRPGTHWVARYGGTIKINAVCYGNGRFVAVGEQGLVMTSEDTITWTTRTPPEALRFTRVLYADGQFVACARTGTTQLMTSPDGITWTARPHPGSGHVWITLCYGNGLFVAVSETSDVLTSPDAIHWTLGSTPTGSWASSSFGNGRFVVGGQNGKIVTSPDAVTWTPGPPVSTAVVCAMCFDGKQFIAACSSGTHRIFTSPDAAAWTPQSTPSVTCMSLAYGGGVRVGVGSPGLVFTSLNGTEWIQQTAAESNAWGSVCYGNGRFVAAAYNGANRIMTSP